MIRRLIVLLLLVTPALGGSEAKEAISAFKGRFASGMSLHTRKKACDDLARVPEPATLKGFEWALSYTKSEVKRLTGMKDAATAELGKHEDELDRLMRMAMESAESAVIRNYLDWLTSLPWSKSTTDNEDIAAAETTLNQDHYGLKEVKARILEFLAVRKLKPDHRGSIRSSQGMASKSRSKLQRVSRS